MEPFLTGSIMQAPRSENAEKDDNARATLLSVVVKETTPPGSGTGGTVPQLSSEKLKTLAAMDCGQLRALARVAGFSPPERCPGIPGRPRLDHQLPAAAGRCVNETGSKPASESSTAEVLSRPGSTTPVSGRSSVPENGTTASPVIGRSLPAPACFDSEQLEALSLTSMGCRKLAALKEAASAMSTLQSLISELHRKPDPEPKRQNGSSILKEGKSSMRSCSKADARDSAIVTEAIEYVLATVGNQSGFNHGSLDTQYSSGLGNPISFASADLGFEDEIAMDIESVQFLNVGNQPDFDCAMDYDKYDGFHDSDEKGTNHNLYENQGVGSTWTDDECDKTDVLLDRVVEVCRSKLSRGLIQKKAAPSPAGGPLAVHDANTPSCADLDPKDEVGLLACFLEFFRTWPDGSSSLQTLDDARVAWGLPLPLRFEVEDLTFVLRPLYTGVLSFGPFFLIRGLGVCRKTMEHECYDQAVNILRTKSISEIRGLVDCGKESLLEEVHRLSVQDPETFMSLLFPVQAETQACSEESQASQNCEELENGELETEGNTSEEFPPSDSLHSSGNCQCYMKSNKLQLTHSFQGSNSPEHRPSTNNEDTLPRVPTLGHDGKDRSVLLTKETDDLNMVQDMTQTMDGEKKIQTAVDREKTRQTAVDREKKRQTAVDREEKRQTAVDREKKRQKMVDREKKRETAVDREEKRQTAVEREKKMQKVVDREKKRQTAVDREKKRQKMVDREKKRQTAVEREEKRQTAVDGEKTRETSENQAKTDLEVDAGTGNPQSLEPATKMAAKVESWESTLKVSTPQTTQPTEQSHPEKNATQTPQTTKPRQALGDLNHRDRVQRMSPCQQRLPEKRRHEPDVENLHSPWRHEGSRIQGVDEAGVKSQRHGERTKRRTVPSVHQWPRQLASRLRLLFEEMEKTEMGGSLDLVQFLDSACIKVGIQVTVLYRCAPPQLSGQTVGEEQQVELLCQVFFDGIQVGSGEGATYQEAENSAYAHLGCRLAVTSIDSIMQGQRLTSCLKSLPDCVKVICKGLGKAAV